MFAVLNIAVLDREIRKRKDCGKISSKDPPAFANIAESLTKEDIVLRRDVECHTVHRLVRRMPTNMYGKCGSSVYSLVEPYLKSISVL